VIRAECFLALARERGFGLYAGVPCSYLEPLINGVIDSDRLRYVGAANEGDAVAIATGAQLAGMRSVALFQNSGLGNAVNPLTSLNDTFRVPVLLITSLRGDPSGDGDEPQHAQMGSITGDLLSLMGIPWEYLPGQTEALPAVLDRAVHHMDEAGRPYALVMRKGTAEPRGLASAARPRSRRPAPQEPLPQPTCRRRELLDVVARAVERDDVVIATTGYTGRELYAIGDRENQFYMVGSMGCAVSLGLGIALVRPERRVIVLDGDGAALMRLGALATVGHEGPPKLVHVLLDNGVHESTGGQATVSRSIDFRGIAAACGYRCVFGASTPDELGSILKARAEGPVFVHAPILPGVEASLPRPKLTPPEVAGRLRAHLAA
jgi:phosphonopyruvate decarboxylase